MKQTTNIEQLIDGAIANDRCALPQQSVQPPAGLLSQVASTPAVTTNAALSVTSTGISFALKVVVVATLAAGSASWWALSRLPESTGIPQQTPAQQQVIATDTDSLRKKKDSTVATKSPMTFAKQSKTRAAETPFIPSEKDLPTPTGTLETRVKDSAAVNFKFK